MGTRIEWIDICKALAIFAMVFCHVAMECSCEDLAIDRFVHLWHMPIFFLLSGCVFNTKKYVGWENFISFFISRIKSLIIPYLTFGFICVFLCYLIDSCTHTSARFSLRFIADSFVWNNGLIPYGGIQWFLTCLFFTELLFVLFANIMGLKKRTYSLYIIICVMSFGWQKFCSFNFPFSIGPSFLALLFFSFGVLFKQMIIKNRWLKNNFLMFLSVVFLMSLYFVGGYKVNIRCARFLPNFIIILSLFVSLLIIMLVKEFEKTIVDCLLYKYIRKIGQNSLMILLLNAIVRKFMFLSKIPCDNYLVMISCQVFATIIVISVILYIARFVNKFCPYLIGRF